MLTPLDIFRPALQYYTLTMKSLLFLLLAGLASISADDVVDLGDADFDSKLADMDTALVMFYAPWSVLIAVLAIFSITIVSF